MKPETMAKARLMLSRVLEDGATYREVGEAFHLGRSTVERLIKALVLQVSRDRGIPGLDEDALLSLTRLRQHRDAVMSATSSYVPGGIRLRPVGLTAEDIAAGASRVRARSENANRDVALLYVLFCTGAKPIEIARMLVSDYLNADGSVRECSESPAGGRVSARRRPLFFKSARACMALDAYLAERVRCKLGTRSPDSYRGLDPDSALFLTETGRRFEMRARGAQDPREHCPLMMATFRIIFQRARWAGFTAQGARRLVARRLAERGADEHQVGELLGLSSTRSVRRLLSYEPIPLASLTRDLV